jgi:hypothetical protein
MPEIDTVTTSNASASRSPRASSFTSARIQHTVLPIGRNRLFPVTWPIVQWGKPQISAGAARAARHQTARPSEPDSSRLFMARPPIRTAVAFCAINTGLTGPLRYAKASQSGTPSTDGRVGNGSTLLPPSRQSVITITAAGVDTTKIRAG